MASSANATTFWLSASVGVASAPHAASLTLLAFQLEQSAVRSATARPRSSSVHWAPPAFAALRATSSTSLRSTTACATESSSSGKWLVPRLRTAAASVGCIAEIAVVATALASASVPFQDLPASALRTRFFAKSCLKRQSGERSFTSAASSESSFSTPKRRPTKALTNGVTARRTMLTCSGVMPAP